jgi:hypothetical protein
VGEHCTNIRSRKLVGVFYPKMRHRGVLTALVLSKM